MAIASLLLELLVFRPGASILIVFGKWFVFWGVGARLFLAGLRQMIQPEYTAKTLLGIHDPESLIVVRELGFATLISVASGLSVSQRRLGRCLLRPLAQYSMAWPG